MRENDGMTNDSTSTTEPVTRGAGEMRTIVQGESVGEFPAISAAARRGNVRRVTEIGEDVLHRTCDEVTEFGTQELSALIDDLFTTMLVAEGVGLAANQIGVDAQIFVYDLTDDEQDVRYVGHAINPRIEVRSPDVTEEMREGCLSVPGPAADLFRPYEVVLHAVDQHGQAFSMPATGYLARCFQHETGHVQGQLYVDLLAKRTRRKVLAEMQQVRAEIIERRTQIAESLDKTAPEYPEQIGA